MERGGIGTFAGNVTAFDEINAMSDAEVFAKDSSLRFEPLILELSLNRYLASAFSRGTSKSKLPKSHNATIHLSCHV